MFHVEGRLYLYLLTQNSNSDYDTYDGFVWCAYTTAEAIEESVKAYHDFEGDTEDGDEGYFYSSWVRAKDIKCRCIGRASSDMKPGRVLGSFNAG